MNKSIQLQVEKVINETQKVKRLVLGSKQIKLPTFGPGAHITLHLPMGTRQYSLTNNPVQSTNNYEIAVKRIGGEGSGSGFIHDHVKKGVTLTVSIPDNYFPLHLKANHHVFYAAGIGITPVLSMISYLKTIGHSFELHYVARSREECAFYEQLQSECGTQSAFYFMERSERMKRLKETMRNRTIGTHVYMCGPQAFMEELVTYAKKLHFPSHHIHVERFAPVSDTKNRTPFTVSLEKRNKMITVEAEKSLLESLADHDIKVPYACRMGICGTCEVIVNNGKVQHLDSFLTEKERKTKLLSCVSRGVNHISIDL
ncbi:PDR/VanB family oxidoreductase [Alkalihalobacillus sp. AL-G]|uniref:PDR/VanB family oxidoreductase n=1 Tax=Alkalihalobacillus sp. AL-G TaxID=2926399 RepID=UPI002729AB57|nr:PDR/VanB family oxidoreductase [Alkalihalobacillus sp. AL-G]WLD94866.1 PDR/VanB family oxidoreductase [Alkalihalobacillus sp. AL-G]